MEKVPGSFVPPPTGAPTAAFGTSTIFFSFFTGVLLSLWFMRSPTTAKSARFVKRATAAITVGEPVKMVLVVRKDLKMSSGKIAAQCSHAAVAVVDDIREVMSTEVKPGDDAAASTQASWTAWSEAWRATGQTKIALQVDAEEALLKVHGEAKAANLPTYVIADAGRTQIAAGSRTVVAVGPAPVSKVDAITGKLKVL